jgi:multiple sugar transport system ATP-binding protein
MNFATVELGGDADRVTVALGGQELVLPDAVRRRPGLARYLGSRVVVGLRPAAFSVTESADRATLTIVPLGVESLGDEKHVLFRAPLQDAAEVSEVGDDVPVTMDEGNGAQLWTAKVTQHTQLAIGHPVPLTVDLSEAYFFDPVSGEAVAEAHELVPATV